MLPICEIFKSIQGESSYAGKVCSFVRLAECNLSCTYCDTGYARTASKSLSIGEIVAEVELHNTSLVEITGGEPLLHPETPALCAEFIARGKTVLVETNGSLNISHLPKECIRIMDIKCPSSGMTDKMIWANTNFLHATDECKFVIATREDFTFATKFIETYELVEKCGNIIFSPVFGQCEPKQLAEWILENNTPCRLGLQIHKYIWGLEVRGV